MTFPFFGDRPRRHRATARRAHRTAGTVLRERGLRRTYELARQLLDGARHARASTSSACSSYLGRRATPTPRRRRGVGARSTASCSTRKPGYCQQFSGAMALLLRMGGIPARVVTGLLDRRDRHQDRRVRRARLRRALLGRGLLPRLGLGHVRPDARRLARAQPAGRRARASAAGSAGATPASAATRSPSAAPASRRRPRRAPWWRIPAIVARRARRSSGCSRSASAAGARGAPPALSELERALRRTRRDPAPGHDAARAGAALRGARPAPPATSARCARAATATSRAARRARSAAACGPSSDAGPACSVASRAWWALPPYGSPRGPTIAGWTMSMTSISEGWRCSRTGTSTRPRPARQGARPGARQDLDPRGAGPGVLPLRRLRGGARGVRGGRRARADERLRAVLPRPRADAARARPPRRASR